VDTREYEKIGGYSHDEYSTDMGTGTGRIFIQRVGYEGVTIRTLPTPLTSLQRRTYSMLGGSHDSPKSFEIYFFYIFFFIF